MFGTKPFWQPATKTETIQVAQWTLKGPEAIAGSVDSSDTALYAYVFLLSLLTHVTNLTPSDEWGGLKFVYGR
jgi:hypothetical protein